MKILNKYKGPNLFIKQIINYIDKSIKIIFIQLLLKLADSFVTHDLRILLKLTSVLRCFVKSATGHTYISRLLKSKVAIH